MKQIDPYRQMYRVFEALCARELGRTERTVNKRFDATSMSEIHGFILLNHPMCGDVHYEVMVRGVFDVIEISLMNCRMDRQDEYDERRREAEAEFDNDFPGMHALPDYQEEVEREARHLFRDYSYRICDNDFAEQFSDDFMAVLDELTTDEHVKFSKKRFDAIELMELRQVQDAEEEMMRYAQ